VLIPWQPIHCAGYVPSKPYVSEPLPSNGRLFLFDYSGFQLSCHGIKEPKKKDMRNVVGPAL
jgi:hypothetical protein